MLAQALAVVEAARALRPVEAPAIPGMWRLQCEPRKMAEAIRNLGETLAEFDATTGQDHDPLALVVRAVRFASSRGIRSEEMISAIRGGGAGDDLREAEALADLKPQPGEIGKPDAITDGSPVPDPAPRGPRPGVKRELAEKHKPVAEQTLLSRAPQPVARPNLVHQRPFITGETAVGGKLAELEQQLDYGDTALADGGDLVQDAGLEMDAISDRLEYIVGKVGWTPRLRALAAAWIHARNKISASNLSSTSGYKLDLQDAMVMAKVSAELAQIEMNPDLGQDAAEPTWTPPVPGMRPRY